jgi:hypothetical protein
MALRVSVALLVALLAMPMPRAHAQGFWQSLFGKGAPPPSAPRAVPGARPAPALPPPTSPYRSPYAWPLHGPYSPYFPERSDEDAQPFVQSGTYRTLCVRLCDGFYFPVSNAVPGSGLARDADMCTASCGSEARLFYYPNAGGEIESMVDLTGMAYTALPNAFKYRKTLVEGCRCRPQPWSEAELARHRAYAQGRSAAPVTATETATRPAEQQPEPNAIDPPPPTIDNERVVARPQPVPRQVEPAPPSWPFPGEGPAGTSKSKYQWRR